MERIILEQNGCRYCGKPLSETDLSTGRCSWCGAAIRRAKPPKTRQAVKKAATFVGKIRKAYRKAQEFSEKYGSRLRSPEELLVGSYSQMQAGSVGDIILGTNQRRRKRKR